MIKFRNSSNEEENEKEDMLLNIPNDRRDKIITEYLDRCKLRHSNLYYEWRKKFIEKHGTHKSNYLTFLYLLMPITKFYVQD